MVMSVQPIEHPERLRVSFAREISGFGRSEGSRSSLPAAAFSWRRSPWPWPRRRGAPFSTGVAALYVVALAVAGRVRFHIGAGFTVPTQIVFVPMLCSVPAPYVPVLVTLALAIGMAPEIFRRRTRRLRVLVTLGNSWFALGPALVFTAASVHSPSAPIGVLVAALAAQVACDFVGNAVRERLRGGISLRELAEEMVSVYLVDAALFPVGLVLAFAAEERPWSIVLIAPAVRDFAPLLQRAPRAAAAAGRAERRLPGHRAPARRRRGGRTTPTPVSTARASSRLALAVAEELGLDAARRRRTSSSARSSTTSARSRSRRRSSTNPGASTSASGDHQDPHHRGPADARPHRRNDARHRPIVRSSHERWDGTGYPDGLDGDEIPLEARIVSACDAFNAMTTPARTARRCRPAEARAELERNAGSQFDPAVVRALVRVIAR